MRSLIKTVSLVLLVVAFAVFGGAVLAASYTLEGGATLVDSGHDSEGAIQLVSDAEDAWSSVHFALDDSLTFADLTHLSADFNVTNDDCTNGSPRFAIALNTASGIQHVFVYLGPTPNYQGCTADAWLSSGDLLENGLTVDTSQLGGTFYDSYATAVASYGGLNVTDIFLVVDAAYAFADGEQTVLVDNVVINDTTFDFEPVEQPVYAKEDCMRNGWRDFTGEAGMPGPFRNQGDCVSFFATGGRNPANG
jgi:hypothetical protein